MRHLVAIPCLVFGAVSVSAADWVATVERYCLECHDTAVQKGDLDIESLLGTEVADESERWEKIVRQLDARHMPPIGEDRPDEPEYIRTVDALVARLDAAAEANPKPGRTDTLRRLTRAEYRNAIRDLFALEIDVAELLPADESSHGFDNVTVGNLSPALLERYIAAARKIARLAVGSSADDLDSRTIRIPADLTQEEHVEGLPLGTRGGALFSHRFSQDGEYEIRILLTRDRNEQVEGLHGQHELEVLVDGRRVASLPVRPPGKGDDHTRIDENLVARFEANAGPAELGVTFVKWPSSLEETRRQPYESHFNYHRHPRLSPAIYQVTLTGPYDPQGAGETLSRERIFTERPSDPSEEDSGARAILGRLMRLAYRRPVEKAEIDRVLEFYRNSRKAGGNFDAGIEKALSAILVSRDFLFRVEKDPEGLPPHTAYPLSDFELASRLSFFLWSSLPDEELLAAAERGELTDPKRLQAQAARMLNDEKAGSLVTNFADQWLYLRNLDSVSPDARLFPDFDRNLRDAFRRETELQVRRVIQEDRSVLDLLETNSTFLNERLAAHYDIPHIYGTRFRSVALDEGSVRGGLLRQGSILTVTSYANRTSPVIRGHWILENLLGNPPPPPPPNVEALDDSQVSEAQPMRERLAAHRERASCASCHNLMDPIGFTLENFDAVGRWREQENGRVIDASGGLPGAAESAGPGGLEADLLQRPELFVRALTEKLMTYGLGRGVEPSDAPHVRQVLRRAAAEEYAFSAIIFGIVRSDPFMMRSTE